MATVESPIMICCVWLRQPAWKRRPNRTTSRPSSTVNTFTSKSPLISASCIIPSTARGESAVSVFHAGHGPHAARKKKKKKKTKKHNQTNLKHKPTTTKNNKQPQQHKHNTTPHTQPTPTHPPTYHHTPFTHN